MAGNSAHKKILRIYLSDRRLTQARAGYFHIIDRIRETLEARGFRVELRDNQGHERIKSTARAGYALFHMEDPLHDRGLTLRLSYFFPFWRLEKSGKRWEFDVAQKTYISAGIDTDLAAAWATRWRGYLFKGLANEPRRDGPIYVALQGRLTQHRSFQSMSPVEMVKVTCQTYPTAPILIGLHPNETYSDQEMAALHDACADHPDVSIQTGGMEDALKTCRFVVTQNSTAALMGYFFHKPAVLFGLIDFHHIGLKVQEMGPTAALLAAPDHMPDFDSYLYWFTMENAIKADAPDVHDRIAERLIEHGWQLE